MFDEEQICCFRKNINRSMPEYVYILLKPVLQIQIYSKNASRKNVMRIKCETMKTRGNPEYPDPFFILVCQTTFPSLWEFHKNARK